MGWRSFPLRRAGAVPTRIFRRPGSRGAVSGCGGRLEQMGGTKVEIDFSIFRAAAELLYSGPWVAERLAAIGRSSSRMRTK